MQRELQRLEYLKEYELQKEEENYLRMVKKFSTFFIIKKIPGRKKVERKRSRSGKKSKKKKIVDFLKIFFFQKSDKKWNRLQQKEREEKRAAREFHVRNFLENSTS